MIKLLCVDCDGVLTDGTYFMNEDGILHKGFYSRDFHGMQKLHKTGVEIAIVSFSGDPVIDAQCDRTAPYIKVHTRVRDKQKFIQDEYVNSEKYTWTEIAFVGDDDVDLELLRAVGLAACPKDAHDKVIKLVSRHDNGLVLGTKGGRGVVRDFVDYIMILNGAKE